MDARALEDDIRRNGLITSEAEFRNGQSARLLLFPRSSPQMMVGLANINNIVRGVFHSGTLGYGIDHLYEGQGYMLEALTEVVRYAFGEMNLHRLEANYLPHNVRSGALLRKLGFSVNGYARDYLMINGRWEDHVLTSLINSNWKPNL